jgi:hypothetical protein
MGMHVHVEVKDYSLDNMKGICQQFLLSEEAIDSFLPLHRCTGSEKGHTYFESNALSVMGRHGTLVASLNAISSCRTAVDLCHLMNPGLRGRYHKLNLQNILIGRQPTIEFRQHHATKDEIAIISWVRFCILFVSHAAQMLPLPKHESNCRVAFDELFDRIVRCPVLKEYYSKKRARHRAHLATHT